MRGNYGKSYNKQSLSEILILFWPMISQLVAQDLNKEIVSVTY